MGRSIRPLLVVLAAIMSFVTVQAVRADEITGKIVEADRDVSMIVIEPEEGGDFVTIVGFPFHNLEAQLDVILDPLDPNAEGITIEVGDCVTVEYFEKVLGSSGGVINKWESLTRYCEECTGNDEDCYDDPEGMTRKPRKTRPKPWPWHEPPGQRR